MSAPDATEALAGAGTGTTANIASHLPAMARLQPFTPAIYAPAGRDERDRPRWLCWTFKQLDDESDRIARGLERVGITRGVRTVLMVTPGLDFFALTFALFKVGAVPVVVDPGMGIRRLGQCLAEAEPAAFIGIPKAHVARLLFGWARGTLKTLVTVGRKLGWGGLRYEDLRRLGASDEPYVMADTEPDETAAILFTSGSTGVPKGAVYSHGNFSGQVDVLRETYGIQPGECDLATFPLFGLFDPALGMTTIVPDMDASKPGAVDPRRIFEAIETFGATNMFGSPALLRRVAEHGVFEGLSMPSLKRVISAGAPVPAEVLEKAASLLTDGAEVHTPYGATESLPNTTISHTTVLGETAAETARGRGVCVGEPVSGVEVKVIKIIDEPIESWSEDLVLADGEVGEIVVKGPRVTQSYYGRPEATAIAKIRDGERVRHRMGDLGRFDDRGRLWFCGRKAHRVETADGPLYTMMVEGVLNACEGVLRTALVGVGPRGEQRPLVWVEARRGANADEALAAVKARAAQDEALKGVTEFRLHPGFPVDVRHNSKIFREQLTEEAAALLG